MERAKAVSVHAKVLESLREAYEGESDEKTKKDLLELMKYVLIKAGYGRAKDREWVGQKDREWRKKR